MPKVRLTNFQTVNLDSNHEELSQISTFAIRWSKGQPLKLQKRKLACFASNGRAHSAKIPMYWLYLQIFIVQTERNSNHRARYYTTESSYIFFPNFVLCNWIICPTGTLMLQGWSDPQLTWYNCSSNLPHWTRSKIWAFLNLHISWK